MMYAICSAFFAMLQTVVLATVFYTAICSEPVRRYISSIFHPLELLQEVSPILIRSALFALVCSRGHSILFYRWFTYLELFYLLCAS
jgi:hypothetical protein